MLVPIRGSQGRLFRVVNPRILDFLHALSNEPSPQYPDKRISSALSLAAKRRSSLRAEESVPGSLYRGTAFLLTPFVMSSFLRFARSDSEQFCSDRSDLP
jgi:hypothetical protein